MVAVWQAGFWHHATQSTYWVDFPPHVSEKLEARRNTDGVKFEYRLHKQSLTEVHDAPEAKRARCEEDVKPDNFVYWRIPTEMVQVNTVHGYRRRLRRIFIEQDELGRTPKWP